MRTGNPHEHGDGAKLIVAESSPIVGNLAVAIYIGGFGGPMIGTFPDRASAHAFVDDLQKLIVRYGGEPMPVEDDDGPIAAKYDEDRS